MKTLTNEEVLDDFEVTLKLRKKKQTTIRNKLSVVKSFLTFIGNKPVEQITQQDVRKFVSHIDEKLKLKTDSQNMYIVNLHMFIDYLMANNTKFAKKNKKIDFFQDIKLNKQVRDTSEKEYLNREDIIAMLPHCKCQRDRALIFLIWDTGGRVGEILNMNVEDVKYGKKYVSAVLTGKTGTREVVISSSVPDLQLWLNQCRGKGKDPIFTNRFNERLRDRSVRNILALLVSKAGIAKEGKRVNVHSARHGRITELSDKRVPEMHLRKFAGWSSSSDMPSRYIHTKQKEVDKKVLQADGYTEEEIDEEAKPETSMKSIKCACGQLNPFDSPRCTACHAILNEKLLMETREQEIEEEKQKIEAIKQEIRSEFDSELQSMKELTKKLIRIQQGKARQNRVIEGDTGDIDLEE
jgi:integrase